MPSLIKWVVYGSLALYVLAWLVLLVKCWRQREFYAIVGDGRKTRRLWLLTFIFFNPALTLLYAIVGRRGLAVRSPVKWASRAALCSVGGLMVGGFFVNFPGLTHLWMAPFVGSSSSYSQPVVTLKAASIEASDNTSSTCSSMGGDDRLFACRTLAVINESDNPLMVQIAPKIAKKLQELPFLSRVDLYEPGKFPPPGEPMPDVFLRLTLGSLEETPMPYERSLQARVLVNTGAMPWDSNYHYDSSRGAPLLRFNHEMAVDHRSKTTGYESVKYEMAAEDIAKSIAGQLSKTFKDWSEKPGLMGPVPGELMGRYRPAELPDTIKSLQPAELYSGSGLMIHNHTFWRFQMQPTDLARMERCLNDLKAEGWEGDLWPEKYVDKTTQFEQLRASKENRQIQIFRERRSPMQEEVRVISSAPQPPPLPLQTYYIHYSEEFSDGDRQTAAEALIRDSSPELLLQFRNALGGGSQGKLLETLEKAPGNNASVLLWLAEKYDSVQPAKAREFLQRARTLLWTDHPDGKHSDRVKKLAKNLGQENYDSERAPTRAELLKAGYVELSPQGGPIELQAGLGQPLRVFALKDGKVSWGLSVRVKPGTAKDSPYEMDWMKRESHGSFSSFGMTSCGGATDSKGVWTAKRYDVDDGTGVTAQATSLDKPGRFKLTVTATKLPKQKGP